MESDITVGPHSITCVNHGFLRLDGGAMFGSVPKPLWERRISPDENNRILLATRCLLIRSNGRVILVDVGSGDKWSEKDQHIFAFTSPTQLPLPYTPDEVTDVVLTHLHFDHAGGITKLGAGGELILSYPNARIHLQDENYKLAKAPNIRERASYLSSHVTPLEHANMSLLNGSTEIFPGIWVHPVHGHTRGLQYIEICEGDDCILYPSDLIPTSHHLPLPYHMGYDMCAETVLKEKEAFLNYAIEKNAIVIFEHDPEVPAVRIGKNPKGHYDIHEKVFFPSQQ
ncbi:MAG: MBL fold metallo-hydrolase [Bdellovibrionales bacterium]|nr:MBL fold metallo-hydrolase [Bdellovibrionales bacterium]